MKKICCMLTFLLAPLVVSPMASAQPGWERYMKTQKKRVPTIDWGTPHIKMNWMRKGGGKYNAWYPEVTFNIAGKAQGGDVIQAVLKKGRRTKGKTLCRMRKFGTWSKVSCRWKSKDAIKKAGAFAIHLTYKYTDEQMNSKKAKLGVFKFKVKKFPIHPSQGHQFTVDLDYRLGEAYVSTRKMTTRSYSSNWVTLSFFYKWTGASSSADRPKNIMARCFVNGKAVGKRRAPRMKYEALFQHAIYKGKRHKGYVGWTRAWYFVPGLRFRKDAKQISKCQPGHCVYMDQYPGNWVCKIMFDGSLIRVLKFKVVKAKGNANSIVQPHADQKRVHSYKQLVSVSLKKGWSSHAKYRKKSLKKDAFLGMGRTKP